MSVIDDYLKNIEPRQKAELERIRSIVKKLVPDAEETFSYGMPTYKYKNRPLIYFAAFKNHMSIFPTAGPAEALKDKLAGYKLSKGTIQFTVEKPLPETIIKELITLRLNVIKKSD